MNGQMMEYEDAVKVVKEAGYVVIHRAIAVAADSELSAIGHHRPADKEECLRLSNEIRKSYGL